MVLLIVGVGVVVVGIVCVFAGIFIARKFCGLGNWFGVTLTILGVPAIPVGLGLLILGGVQG